MGAPASIRVKNKLLSSCGSRTGKGKLRQSAAAPIGEVSLYVSLAALSKLLKSWPEQSCEMSNILHRENNEISFYPRQHCTFFRLPTTFLPGYIHCILQLWSSTAMWRTSITGRCLADRAHSSPEIRRPLRYLNQRALLRISLQINPNPRSKVPVTRTRTRDQTSERCEPESSTQDLSSI